MGLNWLDSTYIAMTRNNLPMYYFNFLIIKIIVKVQAILGILSTLEGKILSGYLFYDAATLLERSKLLENA